MTEKRRQYLVSQKKQIEELLQRAIDSLKAASGQVGKLREMEDKIDKELGTASPQASPAVAAAPRPLAPNVICFPGKIRRSSSAIQRA